jgi:hypothetical protein
MAPAGFTSCNVEIGGLRFHYTDWGGDGPPLGQPGQVAVGKRCPGQQLEAEPADAVPAAGDVGRQVSHAGSEREEIPKLLRPSLGDRPRGRDLQCPGRVRGQAGRRYRAGRGRPGVARS